MGCLTSKEANKSSVPQASSNQSKPDASKKATDPQKSNSSPNSSADQLKVDKDASSNSVTDNYEIGEEIGRGAFSIVKSAKNRKTGRIWAVKFIDKKFVDRSDLMLLAREIDIMKKVDHPNVLRLNEVYETADQLALVMQLVTGGELFYKIVEKGNYSERDAANIVIQMIKGVTYLHSQGIAHRDLKPENLLCSGESEPDYQPFRVVIADFGLSKIFGGGEKLETSCGTPDYVAPEVITAEGSYDKSVDMWSCGVITYVLLCGFSPFLSSTQTGLFEKIIKAEYDFPDPEWTHISASAKDFIRCLLVKDPEQRYTAQQCLQHQWLTSQTINKEVMSSIGTNMKRYNATRQQSKKTL